MAGLERLIVRIDGDGRGLTVELQRVGGAVDSFSKKLDGASKNLDAMRRRSTGLLSTFRDVVISLSSVQTLFYQAQFYAGGFISKLIDANAQVERMTVLLTGLSKATTQSGKQMEAAGNIQWIRNLANNAPFAMNALTQSFVRFKTIGIDPTNGSLKALTDSVAAFGGNTQVLDRASIAIQQMAGKGVISMEELRQQLGEAIPNAVNLMARAVNMSYAEFVKLVSQGKVRAEPALAAFFQQLERTYGGAGQRMMNTYTGLLSRLGTAFQEFAVKVNTPSTGNGFFEVLKKNLQELLIFMNSAKGATFAREIGESLAYLATKFADLIKLAYEYRDTIAMVGKVLLTYFAGRTIIGTVVGLTTSFVGLYRTITTVGSAMWKYGTILLQVGSNKMKLFAATQRAITSFNSFAGGMVNVSAKGRGLIVTVVSMIARFGTLGLIAAGLIGTMIALANAFNKAAAARAGWERADRAAKAGEVWDAKSLNKRKADLHDQYEEILRDQKQIREIEARRKANGGKYNGDDFSIIGLLNQRLAANLKQYESGRKSFNQLAEAYNRDQADREVQNFRRSVDSTTDAMLNTAQDAYRTRDDEIAAARDKAAKGDKASLAKLTKAQQENNEAYKKKQIEIYTGRINGLSNEMAKATGTQKVALEQALRDLKEARATIQNQPGVDVSPANLLMDGGKGGGKKGGGGKGYQESPAEKEMQFRQSEFERLKAKWVDLKTAEAQLKYEMENNGNTEGFDSDSASTIAEKLFGATYGNGQSPTEQTLDNIVTSINNLKDTNKVAADDLRRNSVLREMSSDAQIASSRVADAFATYNRGFESVSTRINDFRNSLTDRYSEIIAKYQNDLPKLNQILEGINKQVDTYRREVLIDAAGRVKDRNRDLIRGLMSEREVREENYRLEVEYIQDLIRQLSGKGAMEAKLAEDLNRYLKNLENKKKMDDSGKSPLYKWAQDAKDIRENIGEALPGIMDNFVNDLAEGKLNFHDFALSILKDLAKIILKAIIAKAILSALGIGGGAPAPDVNTNTGGSTVFPAFHTGGMVGSGSGLSRSVDSRIFAFAKRYHTGGFPGLDSNEVPIIAKKGEGVFTPEQMRALGSGGGTTAMAPQVNIINQTSQPVEQEQTNSRFDGEKYVVDVVIKHATKPGPLRTLMQGNK